MNLKNKKVMITAGGTREYVDDVRVVTNISTGALGARMAEGFYREGCKVQYVHAKQSVMPKLNEGILDSATFSSHQIVTVNDLLITMESIIKAFDIDIVIHSAAVSDFTFKRDIPVKLSSNSLESFVEHIRKTIIPTPKIIQQIKIWKPDIFLVGFKFTVGKNLEDLVKIARESGIKSGCDLVIANDKEEMKNAGKHIAHFVDPEKIIIHTCIGKERIVSGLIENLKERK